MNWRDKLREILQRDNTSIPRFAKILGYSKQHIYEVLNGKPAGKRLAYRIQEVSHNEITWIDVLAPNYSKSPSKSES